MRNPVLSPCRKICKLNQAGTHCTGCLRSLIEITQWRSYSSKQQIRICQELAMREIPD